MPNCHWFGTHKDHHALLSRIIAQDDVVVMDLYSPVNQPIGRYATPEQALSSSPHVTHHLNLWHKTASPHCEITRGQRNDGTWFERTGSLGFVQFYLAQVVGNRLDHSQTNTASTARMGAKGGIFVDTNGEAWDVGAVNRYSGWLNRQIKKMAVARFAGAYVLPNAAPIGRRVACLAR